MPTGENRSERQRHYGSEAVDALYARVWGDSIHFGLYGLDDLDLETSTTETKRRMANIAGIQARSQVLEVASGWGASARYLARSYGAQIVATNLESAHQNRAEVLRDLAGLTASIDLELADFHALPFSDETFDTWWCQESIVHATDKHAVFTEAFRVLMSGGRLIFSDQTTNRLACDETERIKIAARHGADDLYAEREFAEALSAAGFVDVTSHTWDRHMARHFMNLTDRIERTRTALLRDIDPVIVESNADMWRFAADLAMAGKIGWSCFCATKP